MSAASPKAAQPTLQRRPQAWRSLEMLPSTAVISGGMMLRSLVAGVAGELICGLDRKELLLSTSNSCKVKLASPAAVSMIINTPERGLWPFFGGHLAFSQLRDKGQMQTCTQLAGRLA